ncbi:MAG: aminotransferase class III-fold pyridoxal phosphate-dependent enzyme, partial [Rhodocyclaceae bacterium]|nr:aminotransferase class III-fold pyridoxal phosphate-dependent enzyme [Rhodocyclaceae bacterium]
MSHLMNTYGRLPVAFTHGVGCRLYDTEGRSYLDGIGGIAVNTLGHAHPKLLKAIADQCARMIHVS